MLMVKLIIITILKGGILYYKKLKRKYIKHNPEQDFLLFPKENQKINHRSRKSIISNAGKYWGLIVKINRKCDLCQSRYNIEAHHIVRKSVFFHPGWILLENGIALCWNCHYGGIHSTYYPDVQKVQERIVAWLLEKKQLSYDQLYYRCKGSRQKLSIVELEAIELSLKNYWKEIKQ